MTIKKTHKKELTFFIFIFFYLNTFSQNIDYKDIRKGFEPSCNSIDRLAARQNNLKLVNIDTTKIKENIDLYYSDLGWSYAKLVRTKKDTTEIKSTIKSYKKSDFDKPNDSNTLWQHTYFYDLLDDCENGEFY